MYQIKKFSDVWAVFNLDSGDSRVLTTDEVIAVSEEFPTLSDSRTVSIFADNVESLQDKP